MLVIGMTHAVDKTHRIDQKRANDRWIQAFIVEHQHRIVETRARIHHETARACSADDIAEIGCNEALPMHPRHIQMRERGDGTAHAVGGQSRDRRAFEQEGKQFCRSENTRDELAILQVVAGEGGFVFVEAALDFVHPLIRVVDGLAFAKHRLRHVFQTERWKTPRRRSQRLDAIDQQASRRAREEMVLLETVLSPLHHAPAAPEPQRHLIAFRMFLQHAQVELDHIPADDRIGIEAFEPVVELLQKLPSRLAVFELEVDAAGVAVGRSEHVDLALAATFERDRIKLRVRAGFNIERYEFQLRPITLRRFQLGVDERIERKVFTLMLAAERDGRRDETLHHVTIGWKHIGFVHIHAALLQAPLERGQLPVLRRIKSKHRPMTEID